MSDFPPPIPPSGGSDGIPPSPPAIPPQSAPPPPVRPVPEVGLAAPEDGLDEFLSTLDRCRQEIGKVVLGQRDVVDLCLVTVLAGQHALLEGVPGVAKTLLVRTLAHVLGCDFNRIQFTPDLMPADITGTTIFNMQSREFVLVRGPVFTGFLLADEINRAPAKTQSALLQAMQERCVTIDRETHALDSDFTVFGTQNPVEYEGTYPLPEAQKDRFMVKIDVQLPDRETELELARRMLVAERQPEAALKAGEVAAVLDRGQLHALRAMLDRVTVKPELVSYMVDLARSTRTHESVMVGAGPRATQSLLLASRAQAAVRGRDFVTPDDVKALARATLAHRLVLRPEYEIEGTRPEELVDRILQQLPVPR